MGIIHVLDEQLTNMIAAGEVVDRPVNIVKECVENSLDAGASSIEIEVFEGGIEGIVITDDGCGMSYEDAKMAFERHATSKISTEDELFSISTMGFRGEALPSIASVAKVSLQTAQGQEGCRIEIEYGNLKTYEKADVPAGCRIEVRGLFLHTPARFKYLKKAAYEFSIIADAVNKIALAHPDVRISLKHDGRLIFQTTGRGERREILYQMFGRDAAMKAQAFRRQSDDFVISGYAIQPSVSRASKSYIYLCLNGRTIRSWPLVNAVIEGYREYLPRDRYPVCFLNIETDFQLVDVNVHPNKLEVRISKEDFLVRLIVETIRELFEVEIQAPDIKARPVEIEQLQAPIQYPHLPASQSAAWKTATDQPDHYLQPRKGCSVSPADNSSWRIEDSASSCKDLISSAEKSDFQKSENFTEQTGSGQPKAEKSEFIPQNQISSPNQMADQSRNMNNRSEIQYPAGLNPAKGKNRSGREFFDQLRVIGQLRESYILCEGPEGLVIIDQHAAQERANFEKISDAFEAPEQILQPLMVPVRKTISSDLMASLDQINESVARYGLHFEPFSDTSVILREEPAWMSRVERDGFLDDMFSWFSDHRSIDMKELRRHLIATTACHSSVRFNHALRQEEMEKVIDDLRRCRQPYHCPHGRPTVITMSTRELEKEFERA